MVVKEPIRHELSKGILFFILLILLPSSAVICGFLLMLLSFEQVVWQTILLTSIVMALPFLLFYFTVFKMYFNSVYLIDDKKIKCKIGLLTSEISISQINYITKGDYPAAGKRPALNLKGLRINYGEGHTIFLSPVDEDKFIEDIKARNNKIELMSK